MIDILINQVDEHNESNILATQEFKPNLVYFIKDKDSEEKMKTLRLYYEKNFKKIKIEELLVEEGDKERLEKIISRLKEKNIDLIYDEDLNKFLINKNKNLEFGARPLRGIINREIVDKLSDELLKGEIKVGDKLKVECRDEILVFSHR